MIGDGRETQEGTIGYGRTVQENLVSPAGQYRKDWSVRPGSEEIRSA